MDLTVRIHWQSFDDLRARLPPCAGIWFIGAPFRIAYPRAASRLLAANVSGDLRVDLRGLFRHPERANDLLAAVLKDSVPPVLSLLALPTLSAPAVDAVAVAVLSRFVERHGMLPYANSTGGLTSAGDAWEGELELVEPADGRLPRLDADAIAARYGLCWKEDALPPLGLAFTLRESDEATGDIEVSREDSGLAWRSVTFSRGQAPRR
jgi:hypothetical protein